MIKIKYSRLKSAAISGMAAAVMAAASSAPVRCDITPQSFLFSQFSSSAAYEKSDNGKHSSTKDSDKVVYSFKIVEIFQRIFDL